MHFQRITQEIHDERLWQVCLNVHFFGLSRISKLNYKKYTFWNAFNSQTADEIVSNDSNMERYANNWSPEAGFHSEALKIHPDGSPKRGLGRNIPFVNII